MHSNREGIPIIFQAGSYYSRQIEWGDMDGGFGRCWRSQVVA